MIGRHEQLMLDRLRAAARVPGRSISADDAEADLLMATDIVAAIRAAGSMLVYAEALEEEAKTAAARLRAGLAEVMADTGATEVAMAHHTVSLVTPKPRPFITDAKALPEKYLVPQPPKPDMAGITKAMRLGPVAGVALSNPAPHIRINSRPEARTAA